MSPYTLRTGGIAGALSLAMAITAASPAFADGPPTADVTNLTPSQAAKDGSLQGPPTSAPSAAEPAETGPVELLPGRRPDRLAAYLFGGAAIVGVGVGVTFGALALHNKSSFDASPTLGAAERGNRDSVVSDVGFGAAVIAGVTSVVLFLRRDEQAQPASHAPDRPGASPVGFTVAPTFGPHGGGAGAVLTF